MRFLRALWRFLKAVKDVLALIALLLFFGLIFAALSSGGKTSIPSGGGALVLQLKGSLSEQPSDARPLDFVSGAGGTAARPVPRCATLLRATRHRGGER